MFSECDSLTSTQRIILDGLICHKNQSINNLPLFYSSKNVFFLTPMHLLPNVIKDMGNCGKV